MPILIYSYDHQVLYLSINANIELLILMVDQPLQNHSHLVALMAEYPSLTFLSSSLKSPQCARPSP